MVTKRELADAQAALNEAAHGLVVYWATRGHNLLVDPEMALMTALSDWDVKRRQLDGQGPAVARSTSIAAAKSNIMLKQSVRRTILEIVVLHWNHFGVGMTSDEIMRRLGGKHQTISARVSELVNTYGLLVDTGLKLETSSGSKAIAWGPTGEAIALVTTFGRADG